MATELQIVNSALIKLGAGIVLAITDNVKRARAMGAQYPLTRDAVLRAYRWSFAMRRTTMASLADAPDWGYSKQFQLPADFLRLDLVNDIFVGPSMSDYINSDEADYSLEGQRLLSDLADPLKIRYIARVDTALFDPNFVSVLAAQLALDTCEEITQSGTKKESIKNDYDRSIKDAVRANAIERPPQPVADDTWMLGRL